MTEEAAPQLMVPPSAAEEGRLDESSRGRLIAVLVAIVLLSEIIPFTYTLAGVVTPLIGKSFLSAGNSITWSISIVGVVGGSTIVLVTKAADLWGKKRLILVACVVFWIGSLICAFASLWWFFLVGRGMQGMAIGIAALCYSLVRDIMPRSWVPITIGFVGTGLGMSAIIAPLIGGVLTDHYSWRSVFWFLVIYMAISVPLFAAIVPESRVRQRQRLDVLGTVLIGLGLGGVFVYLSEGGNWGWTASSSLGYLIGGLVALGLFFYWESKTTAPVMDMKLLRSPKLSVLLAIGFLFVGTYTVLGFAPSFMFLVSRTQVEQAVFAAAVKQSHLPESVLSKFISFRGDIDYAAGWSLFQLAWHTLLWISIIAMILGPLGAVWARHAGARKPLIAGMAALVVGMAGVSAWHHNWWQVTLFALAGGIAFGLYNATAPNMLVDVVPREQQAISAGTLAAAGSIGSAFLTAAMTAILDRFPFQVVAIEPNGKKLVTNIPQVYTSTGYGYVFVLCLGCAVLALILAVVLRAGRTPAQGGSLE
jgi:MFS family permease